MNHSKKNNNNTLLGLIIVFLAGSFVLYQFLLQGSTSLMIPQLMDHLCVNLTEIGFLSAGFFYPYVLLQIPAGILADQYGAKRVLAVSTLLLSLATFWFAVSGTMFTAESARILMGIASAPGVACAMCLGAQWYPKKFAMIAGIFEMMGMIGGALGDFLLSKSIMNFGSVMTMVFCAIAGFVLFVLIVIFVRTRTPEPDLPEDQQDQAVFEQRESKQFLKIICNIHIWKYCLYGALLFGVISAFATLWAIPFLKALYPGQGQWVANATAMVFVGAAIGSISSGYLVSKFGSIKLVMFSYAFIGVVSFILVLCVSLSQWLMMVVLLFCGLAAGAYVLAFDCVKRLVPASSQGMAMGLTNMMVMLLGSTILQPFIGWLLGFIGNTSGSSICQADTVVSFQVALLPILLGLMLAVIISLTVGVKSGTAEK